MSCVDDYNMSCASIQTDLLSAQKNRLVVKTKIELGFHADACAVGDQCLVVHDHKRQVNICSYDPKGGSKHVHLVDVAVAYTEPKTGQVVIFLINQTIKMKGFDHHLLCAMYCCMNGVLIIEVPNFWSPFPVRPCMPYRLKTLSMTQIKLLFH